MVIGVCVCIIVLIFAGDLWIKNTVERTCVEGETKELLKGRLFLRKHHNRGAMLNAGQEKQKVVAFVSVVMTAVTLVVFLCSLGQKGNHTLRIGLALLLGGAFSNTYDRLKRKYVVDYFSFGVKWKWLRRIIFNLSDFCIIIGALTAAVGAGR